MRLSMFEVGRGRGNDIGFAYSQLTVACLVLPIDDPFLGDALTTCHKEQSVDHTRIYAPVFYAIYS